MTSSSRAQWGAAIWRIADPKITLASAAGLLVGTAAAAVWGPLSWGWLALTAFGLFCFEAAKNASGEIFDFDSGADQAVAEADRSPFSGGKRVLVDGLVSRRQIAVLAAVFYGLSILAGLGLVVFREPRLLALGLAGAALAFFYHAPPLRLAYRGLGELAVALAYGPVITCGAFLVQRQTVRLEVFLLSLPLGVLIACFLLVNEFPDAAADASAGKRTWVVRLGKRSAGHLYLALAAAAYLILLELPFFGLGRGVLLGLLGLPLSARAAWRLLRAPESTPQVIPAQAWSLLAFLLYAVGVALGLQLGR